LASGRLTEEGDKKSTGRLKILHWVKDVLFKEDDPVLGEVDMHL
jgi:hypothetical protein